MTFGWCHGGLFQEDEDGQVRNDAVNMVVLRATDYNDGPCGGASCSCVVRLHSMTLQ